MSQSNGQSRNVIMSLSQAANALLDCKVIGCPNIPQNYALILWQLAQFFFRPKVYLLPIHILKS